MTDSNDSNLAGRVSSAGVPRLEPAMSDQPLELEPGSGRFKPVADVRPRMYEPLPVKLVAVNDVRLPAPDGVEELLDGFYVGMFGFERMEPATPIIYRAENFLLTFEVQARPVVHESLRPLAIEILSLPEAEQKLIEAETPYTWQRGTAPGSESILLLDPAGNWMELVESRAIA